MSVKLDVYTIGPYLKEVQEGESIRCKERTPEWIELERVKREEGHSVLDPETAMGIVRLFLSYEDWFDLGKIGVVKSRIIRYLDPKDQITIGAVGRLLELCQLRQQLSLWVVR